MKQILSDADRSQLDKRIAETEKQTRAQIVLASVQRSDSYAEIPWKAFAFGASIASLVVIVTDLFVLRWQTETLVLLSVAVILASGAIFALLSVVFRGCATLFLSPHRKETECMQYAESLFLARELFATSRRTGVLMLISLFERQVILLPDTGLNDRLNADTMQNIIVKMTSFLKRNETNQALEAGLERLSGILETGAQESGENELSNEIIEKNGI